MYRKNNMKSKIEIGNNINNDWESIGSTNRFLIVSLQLNGKACTMYMP